MTYVVFDLYAQSDEAKGGGLTMLVLCGDSLGPRARETKQKMGLQQLQVWAKFGDLYARSKEIAVVVCVILCA